MTGADSNCTQFLFDQMSNTCISSNSTTHCHSLSLSLSHFYCIEEWTKSRTKLFVCILEMSKKMNIRTFVYLLDDGLAGKMPQPLHLALERFTLMNKQCRKRKKRDLSIRFLCIFEGLEPFCRFFQKNCAFVTAPESSDSNKNTRTQGKLVL